MRLKNNLGFYVTQHLDTLHLPIEDLLQAFKHGFTEDNLIDSRLPGLSTMVSQIPNSRQRWLSERMAIDAISRDYGSANLFLTVSEFIS
jgi:hypothetical protein